MSTLKMNDLTRKKVFGVVIQSHQVGESKVLKIVFQDGSISIVNESQIINKH